MKGFIEFTGKIMGASFFEKNSYFVIRGEDNQYRLFEAPGRDYGTKLSDEDNIERHKRYDLNMDTNMIFTIREFSQCIVSYRWKTMRQISELVRYIIDQARLSDYKNGLQEAVVWMQKLQPTVNFPITDEIIDEVEKGLRDHSNVEYVERNGGWLTITARFN